MDDTNQKRVTTLRDAQLKQGDKKPLKEQVPDPVSTRKTEVPRRPTQNDAPNEQEEAERPNINASQRSFKRPVTDIDPDVNAKAIDTWPEHYLEDDERVAFRQKLEFAMQNLIRKSFTVFVFQIIFCLAIIVNVWDEGIKGETYVQTIPLTEQSFCQFIAGVLMQMYLNHEVSEAMNMMKYAINHPWKFKYPTFAFFIGFCQAFSTVLTALVCYFVIVSSESVLDLAKDFTALMIISEIDNQFAYISEETIAKDILAEETKDIYKDLFMIETTTSYNAREYGNTYIPNNDAWDLIKDKWLWLEWKERVAKSMEENENWHRADYPEMAYEIWKEKKLNKDEQNYQDGERGKKQVNEDNDDKSYLTTEMYTAQPREISLSPGVRFREFGVVNSILRVFYQILRILFVGVWFYFLPIFFVVFANLQPVLTYQAEYQKCAAFAPNDCIGANEPLCINICNSEREQLKIGDIVVDFN